MLSRQKLFNILVLLIITTLAFSACVRPAPIGEVETVTPDPNVGGGIDVAPLPTPEGVEQMPPTPEGAEQMPPTPEGVEQMPPTPEGVEQMPPTPEGGEAESGPETDVVDTPPPVTEGQPDQAGGAAGTQPTQEVVHTVQPGENLYRVGLRYGYSWMVLARYNGIVNPNYVVVGQAIRIPAAGSADGGTGGQPSDGNFAYYVVQPGDNLFRIGLRYGMSWVLIAEANGIVNPNYVVTGQVLKIPVYPAPTS